MFVRHLKKFNNQAELEAALAAGMIASPYVAIDASDNVANMVMPSDQEPAEIEYTQEEDTSALIRLLSPINREDTWEERGNYMYSKLNFTADVKPYEGESDFSMLYPVFRFIRKSDYLALAEENETEGYGWSAKELLWNAAAYPGDYTDADPEDKPDNWDSSVNFEVDDTGLQGPWNPQELEDVGVDEFTWMLIAVYTDDGDMTWGPEGYPGDDAVYGLGEIYIPMYSPVTIDGSILYEIGHAPGDEFPEYEARLKFPAFTSHFNDGDYTNLKFMFVSKPVFDNGYGQGLSNADIIADVLNSVPDGPNGYFTVNTDSSVQGYYITSWYCDGSDVSTGDFDCIYLPTGPEEDYEGNDGCTYWLVAGYEYKSTGDYAPNAPAVGIVGSVRVPYYLESNPSNILKHGEIWVNDNDGTEEYWYDVQVTPNSCYPQVGVGLYSKEAFETAYTESGTSDSSTEYLNTYQDDGNMLEYTFDADSSNGFGNGDLFDPTDIPGYTEGDTICMAMWFIDGNGDIVGDVTMVYEYEDSSSGGDSSTDVSLGYKFTVGQDNSAYFNTDYYPTANTVVQLKGIIQPDGNSSHGIAGNVSASSEWTYRIFGYGSSVYCDRETNDTSYRLYGSVENLDSSVHEYEFGNFYIKVDGSTVATSETSMANYETPNSPMFVFAGSAYNHDEIRVWHLAPAGTELEYIKFLEPDGNGGLDLQMDLRPALDASGNICLYDEVSGDVIYPSGSNENIIATVIVPDSSVDASSNAYISSFVHDLANSWYDDQEGVQHDCYYPVIEMFNNDASMNMFQFGSYAQSDFDNYRNNYNSLEEFYEAYAQSYIGLSTIFDGSTNASWETEAWLEFDTANISKGDYLVFIGRYVNADAEETLDEWDNPVTVYTVNESKAWLSLGTYGQSEPSDEPVRLGTITPEYQADESHESYGLLLASLNFDIQADEIEDANMAFGKYGWPFIYLMQKTEFDDHYYSYEAEHPGTSQAEYAYLVVNGYESVTYWSASTDEDVPYEPSGSWIDSSVSYYSEGVSVPPEFDMYYEEAGSYYIFIMYTDGQWNVLNPSSYPDAVVGPVLYVLEPYTIDSSLEASLVQGNGTINGETIEGTTYYTTRHQDFIINATPNTIFDRVKCGVYSNNYFNVVYNNYTNDGYNEDEARDLTLSGMCTQINTIDSTMTPPHVDSSMNLVDGVNCNTDYDGYNDTLYLVGYFYSSQDNSLRTDWIDLGYHELEYTE